MVSYGRANKGTNMKPGRTKVFQQHHVIKHWINISVGTKPQPFQIFINNLSVKWNNVLPKNETLMIQWPMHKISWALEYEIKSYCHRKINLPSAYFWKLNTKFEFMKQILEKNKHWKVQILGKKCIFEQSLLSSHFLRSLNYLMS